MADLRLPSINRVMLVGRLTRDPELRFTPDGTAVCNLRMASDNNFKDRKTGEWKKGEPLFVDVVLWRELAERMGEVLRKGSPVYVEGNLRSRTWETQEGQKRTIIEIQASRAQNLERLGAEREEDFAVESKEGKEPEGEDLPF